MLLEIIEDPKTDIISALERKIDGSKVNFGEDYRVECALDVLENKSYTITPGLANTYDRLCFLDDAWVMAYLMDSCGRHAEADAIFSNLLFNYDPFKALNPVTRGFAYCRSIEDALSVEEVDKVTKSMDFYFGRSDDTIVKRMYPSLKKLGEINRRLLSSYEFGDDIGEDMEARR